MLGYLLSIIRERVYDQSSLVEWDQTTMYDSEAAVDRYDVGCLDGGRASRLSATDVEFVDMVGKLNIRSVLDIGCGAGAFYYLLKSAHPNIKYKGSDLSSAQIRRAKLRFGDDLFEVKNVEDITVDEFAKYDAVHAHSVFSFMTPKTQIEVLNRICCSGAKLFLETGTTKRHIDYAPRSAFYNFMKLKTEDGRSRMTAVSFPYSRSLKQACVDHTVTFRETPYAANRALNGSGRSGGASADLKQLNKPNKKFDKLSPFRPKNKLLMARIAPSEWKPARDYEASEVKAIVSNGTPPTVQT